MPFSEKSLAEIRSEYRAVHAKYETLFMKYVTLELTNQRAREFATQSLTRNWWFSCASEAAGDKLDAGNHEPGESAFK
jgi:hypothetical protein